MSQKQIAIIGGGIAGSSLALLLRQQGIAATVYEARSRHDKSGGGLGLATNGMAVLEKLGLAEKIRKLGSPYTGFRFFNQHGELLAEVEDQKVERPEIIGTSLARHAVHQVLTEELLKQGVELHFEKKLKGIEIFANEVRCQFEDRTEIQSDIVIAADGLNSRIRKILMPDFPRPQYTGLLNFGGFIPERKVQASNHPAAQRMDMTFGYAGFFGLARAGILDGEPSFLWWNATPIPEVDRSSVMAMNDNDKKRFLLDLHQGWCPPVESVIKNTNPGIFADNIYDIQSLPSWSKGPVVLIGDSAHAVSPHSGQGASMALEDAWTLSCALKKNLNSPEAAFKEFEAARRSRVERVVRYGRQSGNSKRKLGPVGAWIRDRFISSFLPAIARHNSKWLYRNDLT